MKDVKILTEMDYGDELEKFRLILSRCGNRA